MKTLYFDCFAGASGNMILGGLLALGVDRDELIGRLQGLSVSGFEIRTEVVDRSGISSTHVQVSVPEEKKHRHLHNIEKIISESELSTGVKDRALAIFRRLAEAEASVHGIEVSKVHFHEVGAMDAIVDIVGSCIGFEMLGIERFACSKIHVGSGFVKMEHGTYPVPPPAVERLLHGVPTYATEITGELMTPTGAAIITTVSSSYGPRTEMIVEASGYGAGTREYENFPNTLRMQIGRTNELGRPDTRGLGGLIHEELVVLETNVDDISAQAVGFVIERALEMGALDCWASPIQMKKSRPAFMLSVLCRTEDEPDLSKMLFTETTTLGVRASRVTRSSLPRSTVRTETRFGPIDLKVAALNGEVVNVMPEYEQVRAAALQNDVPFRTVHAEAMAAYKGLARPAAVQ